MCLAIPMKVKELIPPHGAVVESGDVSLEVSVRLLDHVDVGDYVIVHTGFAIEVMDEKAAEETLRTFRELAEIRRESGPGNG